MRGRSVIRIVAVVLVAGLAAVLLRSMFMAATAPQEAPENTVMVAFAATSLPQGLLLRPDDVDWIGVPEGAIPGDQFRRKRPDSDDLTGAVVRHPVAAGAPITSGAVVLPDAPGFLSAALQPDMRAVSVGIDEVTGNAGLILPGDTVDLILTQDVDDARENPQRQIASETVLSNVRVIAMGTTMRIADDEAKPNAKARTATLEVRPREAEMVAVAARLGHLSLVLRSLATLTRPMDDPPSDADILDALAKDMGAVPGVADAPGAEDRKAVWAGDVSVALREAAPAPKPVPAARAPQAPPPVQVFRGSEKSSTALPGYPFPPGHMAPAYPEDVR